MSLFGEPTEIEKQDLEVHVEMAAMRKQQCQVHFADIRQHLEELKEHINTQMETLDMQINTRKADLEKEIDEIKADIVLIENDIIQIKTDQSKQTIKWGTAIIAALVGALGGLIIHVVLPILMSKIQ